MSQVIIQGEPAATWEDATQNTGAKEYSTGETGITDIDSLDAYFERIGGISYELYGGERVYDMYRQNPSNNTFVTVQGVGELLGISAGYVSGFVGEGNWTMVSSATVLSSIMRAMFSIVEAQEVASTVITQLQTALHDWCVVDTDDVPVYVDSDGVAYVLEGAIEAVRDKLIELGAYDAGIPSATIQDTTGLSQLTIDSMPFYFTENNLQYTGSYSTGSESDPDLFQNIVHTKPLYYFAHQTSVPANFTCYICSEDSFSCQYVRHNENGTYTNNVSVTHKVVNNKDVYYGNIPNGALADYDLTGIPYNVYTGNSIQQTVYVIVYGQHAGGQAIAGLTPAPDIPVGFGELSLPLDNVTPGWAAKKKQVATPKRIAGADDDLWLKSPALPLDIPTDNVWEDGYAGDSADTWEGDLADELKQAIADSIADILDDIIANTDATEEDVYGIPVDDSGDTPPAEPPVLNGSSNGLWTMYNPTRAQVNAFGAWLWSDTLIDQIMRQFNSPIDAVIGFHKIYCTPITGSAKNIKAGFLDSNVSAAEITNQYTEINCGTVHVGEYYGNALDYDNTQVSLYLPFVGIVPLNTNVVMGSDITVIYRIDVFTGTCLAQVKVSKQNSNAVMYAFEGNCAVQIPLTASTYTGMVGALMGTITAGVSFMAGDMYHAASGAIGAATSAISNLSGVKQSGSMGSNAGSLGIRIPYLIITRSISAMPAGFEGMRGIPSTEIVSLNSLSGFTSVRAVHLEGMTCTAEESEEIKALLESGVIF